MDAGASKGLALTHNVAHVVPIHKVAKPQLSAREIANEHGNSRAEQTAAKPVNSGLHNKAQPALHSATAIALQTLASQEKVNPETQRQQFSFSRAEKEKTPSELKEEDENARRDVSPGIAKAASEAFEKARKLKPSGADDEGPGVTVFGPNGNHPNAERASFVNITV